MLTKFASIYYNISRTKKIIATVLVVPPSHFIKRSEKMLKATTNLRNFRCNKALSTGLRLFSSNSISVDLGPDVFKTHCKNIL